MWQDLVAIGELVFVELKDTIDHIKMVTGREDLISNNMVRPL